MPEDTMSTQEKIIYKDHDILISVHTMQQEMLRRMDEDRRSANDSRQQLALEMKGIAIEQTRIATEFKSVQDDQTDFEKRVEKRLDAIDAKGVRIDLILGAATILGTVLGIFLGV